MADFDGFDYGATALELRDGQAELEGDLFDILPMVNDLNEPAADLVSATLGAGQYFVYRMRGYDSVLGRVVYWDTLSQTSPLGSYSGPGTPSDIVTASLRVEG